MLGELAKQTGRTVSTISRVFSGQRKPSLDLANRLAMAIGVSLDEFNAAITERENQWKTRN